MKLHIAETFHSIKGEGLWSGTPMFFVRFAGCNVGRQGPKNMDVRSSEHPALKVVGTTCTTYDGRQFGCDTDYKSYQTLDLSDSEAVETFFADIWEHRVVLTGGEPMAQAGAFWEMLLLCKSHNKVAHVETSGTIDFTIPEELAWVACAPKMGYHDSMLWRANEIKLLVDNNFDIDLVPKVCFEHPLVFLCPINIGVEEGYYAPNDKYNLELCLRYVKLYPQWRVGCQLHKLLGVR